eukprot:TRINITY_DN19730_c0_g1_i1.p1 TRINITY_DN19730_c0_g1~~TRINITY_DN19730_c0_g1_i1.p1  ORF type:complete len:263 (+),score=44.79 TRINITY_DN19730_c0_g1_i1:71-790(+)
MQATEDDEKAKKNRKSMKRDKRKAARKEERDKWAQHLADLDDLRMAQGRGKYHKSLTKNLPLQPSCMYPIVVDGRDGVFVPMETVADIMMADCPVGNELKLPKYQVEMASTRPTAMYKLATEMESIQRMNYRSSPTTELDDLVRTALCKYHSVVAALALASVSGGTPSGTPVKISGLSNAHPEAVEMAFFAHGNIIQTLQSGSSFICYYEDREDAISAVSKMNGRKWKSEVLQVTLLNN